MVLKLKLISQFSLAFILFTVIGTISHELGHVGVAKVLGYETTLHYGFMNWYGESSYQLLPSNAFWITLGGPFQTLATSLLGFCILVYREIRLGRRTFLFLDWLATFLALFCLRQFANLTVGLGEYVLNYSNSLFGGDELKLAMEMNWYEGSISIITGILSLLISLVVIFRFIPTQFRFSFIIGGFIGGLAGYYLWLIKLGPIILP